MMGRWRGRQVRCWNNPPPGVGFPDLPLPVGERVGVRGKEKREAPLRGERGFWFPAQEQSDGEGAPSLSPLIAKRRFGLLLEDGKI